MNIKKDTSSNSEDMRPVGCLHKGYRHRGVFKSVIAQVNVFSIRDTHNGVLRIKHMNIKKRH